MGVPFGELFALEAGDAGSEREVIVAAALAVAVGPPAADVTVGGGLRVGVAGWVLERLLQAGADGAEYAA